MVLPPVLLLDMVLLVLDMVLLVLLDMELLVLSVMVVLLMLDMESVKLMLMLRPMLMRMLLMVLTDMLLLPQLPFPPQFVTVSQSHNVIRFPLTPQERSARLFARLSLTSPQLRTARKPSPPNVLSSLLMSDTAPELLVMTPRLDPLLLLPPMVMLLLLLLPQLL